MRRARALAPAALAAGLLLATPGPAGAQTVTICHATGDPNQPYQQLVLTPAQTIDYISNPNDIVPAPPGGCPATLQGPDDDELPAPAPTPTVAPTLTPTPAPAPAKKKKKKAKPTRPATKPAGGVKGGSTISPPRTVSSPAKPVVRPGSATGVIPAGSALPMTGGDIRGLAMVGIGFLLAGAGVRLRYVGW